MKRRILIWASAGLLVAGFWAVFAFVTFPSSLRDVWAVVTITCPVAILGMHYPISLGASLIANALTYGAIGLIVEVLRKNLSPAAHCY